MSVELNNQFAEFFVYDCRKNNVSYGNYSSTQKDIIANHRLIISDQWYDSVYVFKAQKPDYAHAGMVLSVAMLGVSMLSVFLF
jgi:hypothetical protein